MNFFKIIFRVTLLIVFFVKISYSQPCVTPSITIISTAVNFTPCTPVTFTSFTTNAGSNVVYQWQINGIDVFGANNFTFTSSKLKNLDRVTCVMTSTIKPCNLRVSVASNAIIMIAISNVTIPKINIQTADSIFDLCNSKFITFNSIATNLYSLNVVPTYRWKINGVDAPGFNAGSSYYTYTNIFKDGDKVTCEMTASVDACDNKKTVVSNTILMKTRKFNYSFGGNYDEKVFCTIRTKDSGYVLAGYSKSNDGKGDVKSNRGKKDIWVVKMDAQGKMQWEKSMGGSDDEEARSIIETKDGGYMVVGYTNSGFGCPTCAVPMDGDVKGNYGAIGTHTSDIWVVKLSKPIAPNIAPSIEWQRSYGGSLSDVGNSVIETANAYVIAGYTRSGNNLIDDGDIKKQKNHSALNKLKIGTSDAWVIMIDKNNKHDILTNLLYGGSGNEEANCIVQSKDGGFVIAGSATSNDGDVVRNNYAWVNGNKDLWVFKINQLGAIQWNNCVGYLFDDYASCVIATRDDGFIVAGNTTNVSIGQNGAKVNDEKIYVLKILPDILVNGKLKKGVIDWTKTYGISKLSKANSIIQTLDSGFLIVGSAKDNVGPDINYLMLKIKPDYKKNGNVQIVKGEQDWEKRIGGNGIDEATSVIEKSKGNYVVSGFSGSTVGNNGIVINNHHGIQNAFDYWIVDLQGECMVKGSAEKNYVEPSKIDDQISSISVYPNPSRAMSAIAYQIQSKAHVNVRVFDVYGREVATLVNEIKEAGNHKIMWETSNLSSGIYYVLFKTGVSSLVKKVEVLK